MDNFKSAGFEDLTVEEAMEVDGGSALLAYAAGFVVGGLLAAGTYLIVNAIRN